MYHLYWLLGYTSNNLLLGLKPMATNLSPTLTHSIVMALFILIVPAVQVKGKYMRVSMLVFSVNASSLKEIALQHRFSY